MSKTFDRYTSVIFLAIGTLFVWESYGISDSAYGSNVGPNIFPLGLGLILIVLSLRLFYETLKYPTTTDSAKPKLDYKSFIIIIVSAFLYALLLEPLGYVLTTFAFLVIGFQTMKKGDWLKTIIIAAVFSFGVYYLFVKVLYCSTIYDSPWV